MIGQSAVIAYLANSRCEMFRLVKTKGKYETKYLIGVRTDIDTKNGNSNRNKLRWGVKYVKELHLESKVYLKRSTNGLF